MKGREELEGCTRPLGDYLVELPGGRHLILRGKFKGSYADTIPRGYIRNFLLKKCQDNMTDEEIRLFEQFGRKDEDGRTD